MQKDKSRQFSRIKIIIFVLKKEVGEINNWKIKVLIAKETIVRNLFCTEKSLENNLWKE
jgi:hypothetical protein